MYPGHWATVKGDAPAVINADTGERVSFAELDRGSNRLANLLHARGLRAGDHVS